MVESLARTPLSPAAARRLLAETPHVRDEELSFELMGTVFALEDGRALLFVARGRSMLYASRDELATYHRAQMERARRGSSTWLDVLPQGERFAAAVPALLDDVPARLHIDASALDFSMQSLARVEAAIRRLDRTRVLSSEIFPALLAYIGEVIRRRVKGRWDMRLEQDGRSWTPCIVDDGGRLYQVLGIYKELLEYPGAPVRPFVEHILRRPLTTDPHHETTGLWAVVSRRPRRRR